MVVLAAGAVSYERGTPVTPYPNRSAHEAPPAAPDGLLASAAMRALRFTNPHDTPEAGPSRDTS